MTRGLNGSDDSGCHVGAWEYVIMADPAQDLASYSQLDERAAWFYEAIFLTRAMISQISGFGQAYLGAYHDKDGRPFDGGVSYYLHVPPDVPAEQFWSITLYDVDTHREGNQLTACSRELLTEFK